MLNKLHAIFSNYYKLPKEVFIVFIGKLITCIGSFILPILTLILTNKLYLSESQSGFIATLMFLVQIPCSLIGGKLSDYINCKKVLCFFQGISASLYIFWGLNPNIKYLVPMLILASCFYSISVPAYDSVIANITSKDNRADAYSLLYIGINIGVSISPILAGLLFENHLDLLFFLDGITALISIILIIFFVRINSEKNVPSNIKKSSKISLYNVLKNNVNIVYFLIIMIVFYFLYSQYTFSLPIQLDSLFNQDGSKFFGILASVNAVSVVVITPVLQGIVKKFTIPKSIYIASIFFTISFLIFAFSDNLYNFIIGTIVFTISEILISVNTVTFISNMVPDSHRGRIVSFVPIISSVGMSIGPAITGNIIQKTNIFKSWIIVSIISIIAGVLMYIFNIYYIKHYDNDITCSSTSGKL